MGVFSVGRLVGDNQCTEGTVSSHRSRTEHLCRLKGGVVVNGSGAGFRPCQLRSGRVGLVEGPGAASECSVGLSCRARGGREECQTGGKMALSKGCSGLALMSEPRERSAKLQSPELLCFPPGFGPDRGWRGMSGRSCRQKWSPAQNAHAEMDLTSV